MISRGRVAKSEVEQVRKDAGIGVDQYALRGEPLGDGEAWTLSAQ
jgi:hypothetical protein